MILRAISFITASILLIIGGFIYLSYRPLSLAMFRWTNTTADTHWLMSIRQVVPQDMPDWIVYALPDGLWACSYTIFIGTIWDFNIQRCMYLLFLIPLLGIISEFLQGCSMLPGIFDWIDLIAYTSGLIIGLIFLTYINKKR